MKQFIAIVDATVENRVGKFWDFDLLSEAEDHVKVVEDRFPEAFTANNPGGESEDWLVDMTAKTIAYDPLPPDPGPTLDEIYDRTLQSQQLLRALVLCLNDGSIVPGANVSNSDLKAAIKAKM